MSTTTITAIAHVMNTSHIYYQAMLDGCLYTIRHAETVAMMRFRHDPFFHENLSGVLYRKRRDVQSHLDRYSGT
jgi:hypothetical protein